MLGRPGAGMAGAARIRIPGADNRGAAVEGDAIGEQHLRWTRSESSSCGGRDQGAAAETDVIGEQQLRRMQSGCRPRGSS